MPKLRSNKEDANGIGMHAGSAGNSGSWDDDEDYQGRYIHEEAEGASFRF